ncbi:hypothetical protein SOQ14_14290, partial [Erythrobacter sp. T5W1-R]|uniref:hypothetical protein n=1 Tax=Erythrobacter sp. T5W1-R TaxID=3101752 RepID=UPI002AFFD397
MNLVMLRSDHVATMAAVIGPITGKGEQRGHCDQRDFSLRTVSQLSPTRKLAAPQDERKPVGHWQSGAITSAHQAADQVA